MTEEQKTQLKSIMTQYPVIDILEELKNIAESELKVGVWAKVEQIYKTELGNIEAFIEDYDYTV